LDAEATNSPIFGDRLTDASVSNEPETNDKNFVFLHGYNVNPNQARGAFAETFKRMYWSGSHAKFYGVTWDGADTQEIAYGLLATDYHINVDHAFNTASNLASFLSTLTNSGPTTVVAHSLGNILTLSAISDWNAPNHDEGEEGIFGTFPPQIVLAAGGGFCIVAAAIRAHARMS
jgi:esterase/lipase superfamily enzyme